MSGHNKWSTIKHKKGAADAKRGAIFTRLIKEVTVAARMGGGDPGANPRLRSAVLACRAANMPKDNIERGIKKGTGELEGVDYIEATYEGYGPAGVAIFIEVLTDNKNRTVGDIRHAFTKNNGNMGTDGSVAWMFERKGQIVVGAEDTTIDEDKLMEAALESGAEDMQHEGDLFFVTTSIVDLYTVRDGIEKAGFPIQEAKLVRNPTTTVPINEAQAAQVLRLVDWLEENDDVQNVYHNADIDDAIMEKLS